MFSTAASLTDKSPATSAVAFSHAASFAPPDVLDVNQSTTLNKDIEVGKAQNAIDASAQGIAANHAALDEISTQLNAGGPEATGAMAGGGDHSMLTSQLLGYGVAALAGAFNPALGAGIALMQAGGDAAHFVAHGTGMGMGKPQEFAMHGEGSSFKSAADRDDDDVYRVSAESSAAPAYMVQSSAPANSGGMASRLMGADQDGYNPIAAKAQLERDTDSLHRQQRVHEDHQTLVQQTPSPEHQKAFMYHPQLNAPAPAFG